VLVMAGRLLVNLDGKVIALSETRAGPKRMDEQRFLGAQRRALRAQLGPTLAPGQVSGEFGFGRWRGENGNKAAGFGARLELIRQGGKVARRLERVEVVAGEGEARQ